METEGSVCARCLQDIEPDDPVHQEVLRARAFRYGGLAMQAVAVHVLCWRQGRGEANLNMARRSGQGQESWDQMVQVMRDQVEERAQEDQEGEEWRG